jgi:hypothetical protein
MTDNKYTAGKIYKITDTAYNECYIGSTVQTLSQRIAGHRAHYKRLLSSNKGSVCSVYKLFDNYGVENCKIELLELFPCTSVMELRKKEGHFIKTLECVNKLIAGRTPQEWRSENPEYIKLYFIQNKDKLDEQHKRYRHENKDKTSEYNKQHYIKTKDQRIQYNIQNKDKINERRRQRCMNNKLTQLNNSNTNQNAINNLNHTENQEDNTNNNISNLV